MIPLRLHDAERVAHLLCKVLSEGRFQLTYENGRLAGSRKSGPGCKTRLLQTAARRLGLSYSVLHRLAHGTAKHISWRDHFKLQGYFADRDDRLGRTKAGINSLAASPTPWPDLDRALIGPRTRRILAYYAGAIDRATEWDRQRASCTWNYYFGNPNPELAKLDADIKRLGLPATRWDLARSRAVVPILAWPPLRKRSSRARPELLKWAIRFERELVKEEARILRELLREADRRPDKVAVANNRANS